jgi:hypothetical protein
MKIVDKTKCETGTLGCENLKCGELYKLMKGNLGACAEDIGKPFLAASPVAPHGTIRGIRLEDGFIYDGYMSGTRWLPINGYVCIED